MTIDEAGTGFVRRMLNHGFEPPDGGGGAAGGTERGDVDFRFLYRRSAATRIAATEIVAGAPATKIQLGSKTAPTSAGLSTVIEALEGPLGTSPVHRENVQTSEEGRADRLTALPNGMKTVRDCPDGTVSVVVPVE